LLWFSRNQVVDKWVLLDVLKLAANIKRVSLEHYAAWSSKLHLVKEIWSKPPPNLSKVNFDAAIQEYFSIQATVCKNSNGLIIKMLSQVRPPCSPVYGEALAAQLVGVLAISLKLDMFILEGDSSIVVSALQNPSLIMDWHIEHVINDTISSFPASLFSVGG
jgi:hypothetical protein